MYKKFRDLEKDIEGLFEKEEYEKALALLEGVEKVLPKDQVEENYFAIMYLKAILYSECEKQDKCFQTIKEIIDEGYAYPLHFERYKVFEGKDGYTNIVSKNNKLLAELKEKSQVKYEVHLPEDYNSQKKYPLFLALHGDGNCNIEEFSQYWKPGVFLKKDFIFVYLQSSQAICHDGYGWLIDMNISREDIKKSYDSIKQEYPIDEGSVLIGGYSGGAITSIDFTMSNIIPLKGFIGLCPKIKPETFTKQNVKLAAERGVKGVLLEGELVLPMESEEEMMKEFDEVGLQYEYYINKGIGHNPPEDFDEKLSKALDFIMS